MRFGKISGIAKVTAAVLFKLPFTSDIVYVTALATEAAECSAEQCVHLHMPLLSVAFSKQHRAGAVVSDNVICMVSAQKDLAGNISCAW